MRNARKRMRMMMRKMSGRKRTTGDEEKAEKRR